LKAIVQDRYGDADVLALQDIEPPSPHPDQVLVRVHGAGIDAGVLHLMTGTPYLVRPAFGVRRPRTPVPGLDLAGIVEAIGEQVTRFRPGDRVFGIGRGTYAEMAAAPEAKLAHAPSGCALPHAGALAISGLTALQAVRDRARLRPGQHVLITGASGGVGTYAIQIASHLGAEVTAVAGPTKLDLVRALGAHHVVDRTADDPLRPSGGYDAIIDIAGQAPLRRLRRALTATGVLVIVGGEGGPLLGGLDRNLRAAVMSPLVGQRLGAMISRERHDDMAALADLVDDGVLRPVVDRTFPLAEAATAVRYVQDGHARGKVMIIPADD
jgi:NADPH:quinone reductase-like Zn-dependent oxidoreductase